MISPRIKLELTHLLDEAKQLVLRGLGVQAITRLCIGLSQIKRHTHAGEFEQEVISVCHSHPLFELVQQDPYSRRAYEKPRGYAGDAVMLDYVYDGIFPAETTAVGRTIFAGTTRTANGLSVLDRRQRLADLVDSVTRDVPGARIASLAAGHLREADLVTCLANSQLGQWLAIDQDANSLQRIKQFCVRPEIVTMPGSVSDLIRGKLDVGKVDSFYSAGLFDYLNKRLAQKTISTMFQHLNPGGVLLVSNFTTQSHGRYFMEAFMDWNLVYRNQVEMMHLLNAIPSQLVENAHTYSDEHQNIIYLHVVRTRDRF